MSAFYHCHRWQGHHKFIWGELRTDPLDCRQVGKAGGSVVFLKLIYTVCLHFFFVFIV